MCIPKIFCSFIIAFLTITCLLFSQTHHIVEANVHDGPDRVMSVIHNLDNGYKGYSGLNLRAGTDDNLAIGHISQSNNMYTALPEWQGVLGIFSGTSTLGTGNGINLCALRGLGRIRFYTLGTQLEHLRMTLSGSGNLGIGVADPQERLHVANGDIYLSDVNSGVIMRSPNGTCYRMTVKDDGTPQFIALLSCP